MLIIYLDKKISPHSSYPSGEGVAFIFFYKQKLAASEATPYFFYFKKNKGRGGGIKKSKE